MPILPGAEPFQHDGGPIGALVLHGFTGSPGAVRPWAQFLADAGLSVRAPRLPGHGTAWQDLNRTRWQDWLGEAERSHGELRGRCDTVVVMGLSMGAALALRLAQLHRDVAGIVLVNPFLALRGWQSAVLPVLRWVVPSFPGVINDIARQGQDEIGYTRVPLQALHSVTRLWDLVVPALPTTTQPLLVFRSATDHVLGPDGARLLLDRVGSADVEEVVLADSYHVATLDHDAPVIFQRSLELARRVAGSAQPAGG